MSGRGCPSRAPRAWHSLVKVAVGRPQAFHMLLPVWAWFPNYRVDA